MDESPVQPLPPSGKLKNPEHHFGKWEAGDRRAVTEDLLLITRNI